MFRPAVTRPAHILLLLLLFLAGCAGVAPPGPPPSAESPAETEQRAREAFARGAFVTAARLYRRLAETAEGPQRSRLWLRAATARVRAGQLDQAEADLSRLDPPGLAPRERMQMQLLQAEAALLRRQPDRALARLAVPEGPETAGDLMEAYHRLRAQAYTRLDRPVAAARERVLRSAYLKDPIARRNNQEAIWNDLSLVDPAALEQHMGTARDTLDGWLALARLARALPRDPGAAGVRLDQWRQAYPGHPAAPRFSERLRERARELGVQPARIALLLPLSDRFQAAGQAIHDGFLAAYYGDPQRSSQVRVYDTGADPAAVDAAYDRALAEGAEFVIGPLRKAAVRKLAERERLAVPTLALNDATTGPVPDNLFQFGLSPESEARQVAERAWRDGGRNALVYLPDGDWGQRLEEAFSGRWRELGGRVGTVQHYDPSVNDFSGSIKHMLNLDQSELRRRRLARALGFAPHFEPRRRQDADLIFLGAFARQARLIRPQLRFHRAADLPVYATSHVFSGQPDAAQDQDMDGIRFVAMPWSVDGPTPQQAVRRAALPHLQHHQERWQRLAALGFDAYGLTTRLRALARYPDEHYRGETGLLRVGAQHRVHRVLAWARFRDGLPRLTGMPEAQGGDKDAAAAGKAHW